MGTLYYGSGRIPLEIDDELLRYLEAVIVSKLRRSEPFLLTVTDAFDGMMSVWMHASGDLHFRYDVHSTEPLVRAVLDDMLFETSTAAGLRLPRSLDSARARWIL